MGYDFIVQGMSGIMDLTGEPHGMPQKTGVAFADIFAGTYGTIAILAALAQRDRTGAGQQVDIALLDSMVGVLANQALNYLVSGKTPRRMGNSHPNIVPYQVFAVRDGQVILAVGNDTQFRRLCELLELPSLADALRFATNAARVEHRDELVAVLSERISQLSGPPLLQALEERGVPAGPINSLSEVFADPQVLHRRMQVKIEAPWAAAGSVPGVRTPVAFSDAELSLETPAPRLGEHTESILAELGLPKPPS